MFVLKILLVLSVRVFNPGVYSYEFSFDVKSYGKKRFKFKKKYDLEFQLIAVKA